MQFPGRSISSNRQTDRQTDKLYPINYMRLEKNPSFPLFPSFPSFLSVLKKTIALEKVISNTIHRNARTPNIICIFRSSQLFENYITCF